MVGNITELTEIGSVHMFALGSLPRIWVLIWTVRN